MALIKVSDADASWAALKADWRAQCNAFEEDFDTYAEASFSVLDPLAAENRPRAGVYASQREGEHHAVCQLNCTGLPGYREPVLRVRHLMFSPKYDFGEYTHEAYGALLLDVFGGVIMQSYMPETRAKHVHFHLRSPADRTFFSALGMQLNQVAGEQGRRLFESVNTRGAWLYVENVWVVQQQSGN